MDFLSVVQFIGSRRIRKHSRHYRQRNLDASRFQKSLPSQLARQDEMSVSPGLTVGGEHITISLSDLYGHGLILGATNSGKSTVAISVLQQLSQLAVTGKAGCGFGIVDAKGELFTKVQQCLDPRIDIVTLDFSSASPLPYALLRLQRGENPEQLVERRMEVFSDVLGQEGHLSLRMSRMLRWVLMLALEFKFSFPTLECLFSNPDAVMTLTSNSDNPRVKAYFASDFSRERQTTLPALSARLDFLLHHERLRLSFGSSECVDFQHLMDRSVPILINTGGPGMSRTLAATIRSLVVSDIRQAIFTRQIAKHRYLWFLDEAQCLFERKADIENLLTILSMSRSFGSHVVLVTQSLKAAISNPEFVASLDTNFRWLILFRCGLGDAGILSSAMPLTGRVVKARSVRGEVLLMSQSQELAYRLDEVTNLPKRTGYFWLKGAEAKAVLMRSHTVKDIDNPQAIQRAKSCGNDVSASEIQAELQEEERRVLQQQSVITKRRAKSQKPKGQVSDVLKTLEEQMKAHG